MKTYRSLAATGRRAMWLAFGAASLAACAGGQTSPAAVPSTPEAVYDASRPAFRMDDVIGRTGPELDALFGAPALVRAEGAGELRRYDLAVCGLMVLLASESGGERIAQELYASAPSSDAPPADAARCLGVGLKRESAGPGV
ncbi:MAG: hypothetical protein AAFX08_05395 [Pseudomonadota bacterium]